ncbi:MAG: DUF2156 domain-containing protein [Armatimonadetes bacterium]|nr:DUF2156 domain-containing protein [Armatimonadota bacterium]MBS1710351.1 DUF2156 domain-containing protein [Armatimonadota bacterium]MBX3109012.1 DUF2156 domain-containing protein [Fimbriimonadaceae bacterium]
MAHTSDSLRAARLVMRFGRNSACYQIVNGSIRKWFSGDGLTVIGYVRFFGIEVVATEPVSPFPMLAAKKFEQGRSVCYFGAEEYFVARRRASNPCAVVPIGSQPVWELARWKQTVSAVPSLREQFRRAKAKRVQVRELPIEECQTHTQLRAVLDEWLKDRRFSPLHFLVESDTLDFLPDRRIFVAEIEGQVVAWLNLCPIPKRNGWLTEQFPRRKSAPNGTMELLMNTAAEKLAEEGAGLLTMGLVPLSTNSVASPKPAWLQAVFLWTRAHGNRFYNFDGLERFKSKFRPHHWEDLYAVVNDDRFRIRHLAAISRAFTEQPLSIALAKGAVRSLRQEFRWMFRR